MHETTGCGVNHERLKPGLDRLAREFDADWRDTDPVGLLHRYDVPEDIEVAGLFASVLAYGGAEQIRRSIARLLELMAPSPAAFVRDSAPEDIVRRFVDVKHRWTTGGQLAGLAAAAGSIIREHGSIGGLVRSLDDPNAPSIGAVMERFATEIAAHMSRTGLPDGTGTRFLIPVPSGGSACKRLALYFRWMVRGPDGIDFGLWKFLDPARLIVPVDRHIARMARRLGMTARQTPDWRMACDITAVLRELDPCDPVRYDFALVRPGITGRCDRPDGSGCRECPLDSFCHTAE